MSIVGILGFALISAALIAVLRRCRPEFALPVSAAAAVILLVCVISQSTDIVAAVTDITERAGVDGANIKLLFKALGVCYLTRLAADVCLDSGEKALAERVELGGKISVAALSLPLITQVLDIITALLR